MAWEENSRICLHMQLIAILSRIGVFESIKKTKKEVSTIPVLQKLKHLLLQYVKICLARQVGTQGPSVGHRQTKRWASTEQASGTHCPCGVHRMPKRWAFFGH
jgi:hypothetical protein